MNVTTLKQITTHWDGVMGTLSYFHRFAAEKFEHDAPSYALLWRAGQMASLLPAFMLYGPARFLDNGKPVPLIAALGYKLVIGANAVISALNFDAQMAEVTGDDDEMPEYSGQAIYDEADRRAVLVGPREVCAGPPHMIVETMNELAHPTTSKPDVDKVLDAHVGDADAFTAFAAAHMDNAVARFLFGAVSAGIVADLQTWATDDRCGSDAMRTRLSAFVGPQSATRAASFMAHLDDEDRTTLLEHFGAHIRGREGLDGITQVFAQQPTPDDALMRAASGGPFADVMMMHVARALDAANALRSAVQGAEDRCRQALGVAARETHLAASQTGAADLMQLGRRNLRCHRRHR